MLGADERPPLHRQPEWLDRARSSWTIGLFLGAVVGGVFGRLAMLVLRLTSPDAVRGLTSDDGFEIGQVTLKGTYDLIALGSVIGLIGVGAYRVVAPWLIGPTWLRAVTTGLGAGAVVGSMLVHADGIDFIVLEPVWLAIALLFIAIPALFGIVVGPMLAYGDNQRSWINHGWRRWFVPVAVIAVSPIAVVLAPVVAATTFVASRIRSSRAWVRMQTWKRGRLVMQAVFLAIAVYGLLVLIRDISQVLERT